MPAFFLGFGELMKRHLTDARGKNTQLPLADLVRQSVYSRLAGYEDVNDAERLSQDPAFPVEALDRPLRRPGQLRRPKRVTIIAGGGCIVRLSGRKWGNQNGNSG